MDAEVISMGIYLNPGNDGYRESLMMRKRKCIAVCLKVFEGGLAGTGLFFAADKDGCRK